MTNTFIYALTTEERIKTLREKYMFLETDKIFLDRWHNIRGLSSIVDLEVLLESRNMTLDEFAYAIKPFSKMDEKILEKSLDEHVWYNEMDRALNDYFMDNNELEQPLSLDISYVVRPFLHDFSVFFEVLKNKLNHEGLQMTNDAVMKIMQHVMVMLGSLAIKVVSTELNVLKNDSNADKIGEAYLKEKYGTQELLKQFYAEYPVMTRLIVEKLMTAKDFIKKAFLTLTEHSEEINEKLNIVITGNIIMDIEFSVDALHGVDKGNVIYTFRDNQKMVYKSRNLEIEQCFYKFISWINCQRKGHPELLDLPTSDAFYQENFTLSPFIENCVLESKNETKDYYKRLGQLSVILHLLGAHQFNYESILINQGMPYIDSETLFQLEVPLLVANDEMKNADLRPSQPLGNDEHIVEVSWGDDFKQGLGAMSDFILNNRDQVALKIKECFTSKIKVRQHLKETVHYLNLLQFINHPNYLKDMFYLEKLLDNALAYPYKDKRVCVYEIDSMRQGNAPSFYTDLGSKDVITSCSKRITDYFEEIPLEVV
ncbi:MAG: DUF4135 domain-containing protein [Defluviitaleaceae bacterium]|nr:DUF4135 domain-containing protein [Defluviitaleaceae bacterium]